MKMKISRLLPVCVVLCLIASSVCLEDVFPQSQNIFLWRVRSKTTTVYILGSLHFFKKEFYPLNEKIEEAFSQSQVLVVEANIKEPAGLDVQKLKEIAFYTRDDHLAKHVSPETYELVRKETGRLSIPLEAIHQQKPWFLAFTFQALELLKLGFDPRYGIDMHFLTKAGDKKKIVELEGLDYQLNLLSRLSEKDQELFLLYTLKDIHIIGREADRYVRAWTFGDTKTMESLITEGMPEEVKLSSIPEKFFDARNKNMSSRIEEFLTTKETHFVVVGAGHLVGKKGIIEMLIGKGYLVDQL